MEGANPSVFGVQMWCLVRLAYPDVMTEFFSPWQGLRVAMLEGQQWINLMVLFP